MPSDEKETLEALLCQYSRAFEERRHYDALIWQVPTLAIGVLAILFSAYFASKLLVSLVSILFITATILVLIKFRFFTIASTDDLRQLQEKIRTIVPDIREMKWRTCEIISEKKMYPSVGRDFLRRNLRAYFVLLCTLLMVLFVMIVFFAYDQNWGLILDKLLWGS